MKLFHDINRCYDIPRFVDANHDAIRAYHYAVITCIDSNLGEYFKALFRRFIGSQEKPFFYVFLDNGVVIRIEDLVRFCDADDLFGGFDTVWFFREMPAISPPDIRLTSEGAITEAQPETREILVRYMADKDCSLALGDGAGLNIVTSSDHVIRWVHTCGEEFVSADSMTGCHR